MERLAMATDDVSTWKQIQGDQEGAKDRTLRGTAGDGLG